MLKKLLKYEFRATARTFGGLYLALMCLAVLLGIKFRFDGGAASVPLTMDAALARADGIASILGIVYFALIVATMVLTLVTIENRFEKSLLGGEGYLMHTLPVSAKQLIGSKLIAAVAWILASTLVWLISLFAMVSLAGGFLPAGGHGAFLQALREELGFSPLLALAGILLAVVAGSANGVLCLYTASMIGHLFKKYALAASILSFVGMIWLQSMILGILGLGDTELVHVTTQTTAAGGSIFAAMHAFPAAGQFWLDVAITAIPCLIFAAAYFFLTDWLMRTRLNLE